MSSNRPLIILALACALMGVPVRAYASDGFLGGLEDLTGTRQVEQQQKGYEESYQEDYEPELQEVGTEPVRALPENATTVDYVNDTVDAFNKSAIKGDTTQNTMLGFLRSFFGTRTNSVGQTLRDMMILPAIGLVFVWWGVRKSRNMIMVAFRKGKASL